MNINSSTRSLLLIYCFCFSQGNRETGSCLFWLGVHLKSFDNRFASFKSECPHRHTLVREESDGFSIEYEPKIGCTGLSCSLKLHIKTDGYHYEIDNTGGETVSIRKNQTPVVRLAEITSDLLVSHVGSEVVIKLSRSNVVIKWNRKLDVQIKIPAELRDKTKGLCGIWDDDATNDWSDIDLQNQNLPDFVATWVQPNSEGNCNKTISIESPCHHIANLEAGHTAFCVKMQKSEFNSCRDENDDLFAGFEKACKWDFCAHGAEGACATVSNFAAECRNKNFKVPKTWRSPDFCEFKCSNGFEHDECGPEKHATCENSLLEHSKLNYECVEGCFCPPNMVEHNSTCINRIECSPCFYEATRYESGEKRIQRCFKCECRNGQWKCPKKSCAKHGLVAQYTDDAFTT